MAVNKSRVTVTTSVIIVIAILTFFGMMTFSLRTYRRHKILKTSIIANIYLIFSTINYTIQYHLETIGISKNQVEHSGKLTTLISMVIMYMEPILMVSDALTFVINQNRIIDLVKSMEKVNEKLIKQNIDVDLGGVRRLSIILVSLITIVETVLVTYNYVVFEDAIWFLPIYLNAVSKVFYVSLVYTTKEFFQGINRQLESTKKFFAENKMMKKRELVNAIDENEFGYLHKEIQIRQNMSKRRNVSPSAGTEKVVKVISHSDNEKTLYSDVKSISTDASVMCISDKMDKKIKTLCKIHDDICDLTRRINRMFGIQMLLLMAYGFMAITARIYFMYCSIVGQIIPLAFRAAESTMVSSIYLINTSAKCVVVVMVSYNTKRVAQRTGIYLHKVATAIDEEHLYETINHLSLKLLNHSIRFSACGFFDLDMSTLYAITGAITSYIIILIQFNLAALRTKKPNDFSWENGTVVMNETLN